RLLFPPIFIILAQASLEADSSKAPVLEWVRTMSGSRGSSSVGVAADSQGNLYIAGSTTSLDLSTVAAAQAHAGGSPLIRINPSSGATEKLYSPDLASAGSIAMDPSDPETIYAISFAR